MKVEKNLSATDVYIADHCYAIEGLEKPSLLYNMAIGLFTA